MHFKTAIAVASGKGGVGKTNISVNLAVALAKSGRKTALFDADLALANAHILMGVNPERTVVDALESSLPLAAVWAEGPAAVKLISGGSGLAEMMNLSHDQRARIIQSFADLAHDVDCVVVDTPAGIEDNVLDFVSACDRIVIVVVGEPAAFIDAYACVKVIAESGRANHFDIVVNRARNERHGREIFHRFKTIVDRFLETNVYHLATVPEDDALNASVGKCEPLLLTAPQSRAGRALAALANAIVIDRPFVEPAEATP